MRGFYPLERARASIFALSLLMVSPWFPGVALASKTAAPSAKKPFVYDTSGSLDIGADPGSVSGPAILQYQSVPSAIFNPTAPQALNLGQFVLAPSSTTGGQTTTYNGTPFEVEIQAPEFNKTSNVPLLDQIIPSLDKQLNLKSSVENSLLLKGHLDGTVSANGQVNVTATIDSIKLGSTAAATSDQVTHFTFPIRYSQLILPSSWVMSTASPSVTVPSSTANNPIMSSMSTNLTTTTPSTTAPVPAAESVVVPGGSSASASSIAPPASAIAVAAPVPIPAPEPSTIVFFATVIGALALGRRHLRGR